MHDILVSLRDVDGVVGSFVVTDVGQVVARDLPSIFDEATVAEVGMRVARLCDTFASQADPLDTAVVRFQEQKLLLRVFPQGCLCVLASVDVHMPTVRMGMNVLLRRLSAEISSRTVARRDGPSSGPQPPPSGVSSSWSAEPLSGRSSVPPSTPQSTFQSTPNEVSSTMPPPASVPSERNARIYRGRKM